MRSCRQCGIEFEVPNRHSHKYNCSAKCRASNRKPRSDKGKPKAPWVQVQCPCGKTFDVPPHKAHRAEAAGHYVFCSSECQTKYHRRGPGRPAAGAKWVNADGYVVVYVPPEERPASWASRTHRNKGSSDREHRVVMRQMLARDLLPGENVHHKNGIRTDNRPENLELWVERGGQPKGQSAHDLLAWAREIIARYEPIEDQIN